MGIARELAELGSSYNAGGISQFRNRIINGAMVIDQRNAGASINNTNTGTQFSVDRWAVYGDQNSKFSLQQNAGSVTPPVGFTYYLGMTSLSAYTVGTNEQFKVYQNIEGYNMADFGWGTANAKTVTLSFWAYSSLTGTFGGSLINASNNRSYPFAYTISSANTWTQISVTIAGDTTGTWGTTNGIGVAVQFSMGSGSGKSNTAGAWAAGNFVSATGATSVVGTNGATFYITGVQLEVGSTATSFDYRPFTTEYQLCQRYYYQIGGNSFVGTSQYTGITTGHVWNTSTADFVVPFKVSMRSAPSITYSALAIQYTTVQYAVTSQSTVDGTTTNTAWLRMNASSLNTGVGGGCGLGANTNTAGYIAFSSEL